MIKDSRSIRIHNCQCGFEMQRDITSAIVNKFFDVNTQMLDGDKASHFVKEKRSLLRDAIERIIQSATDGHSLPRTFGTLPELERIVRNGVLTTR